ncbi:MAG: glucokinase [Nanoarchaeota archaeon]
MSLILSVDVGGTHANLALVRSGKHLMILHKKQYLTQEVVSVVDLVNEYLGVAKKQGHEVPVLACFAIAGPVSDNAGKLTHGGLVVDAREIVKHTSIGHALVINDFDAVSLSIALLESQDYKIVKRGVGVKKAPIVVIGAGTGFGKSVLVWHDNFKAYLPVPSEIGHGDLIVHSKEEFECAEYIRRQLGVSAPASWEMVLSGDGLVNIYSYLRSSRFAKHQEVAEFKNSVPTAQLISAYRKSDVLCKETFAWFERFYARCAKNAVLDSVACGGVYIAGGIVAKNPDMFGSGFVSEFTNNRRLTQILVQVPVWAITNYDVSLFGCINALRIWKDRVA